MHNFKDINQLKCQVVDCGDCEFVILVFYEFGQWRSELLHDQKVLNMPLGLPRAIRIERLGILDMILVCCAAELEIDEAV